MGASKFVGRVGGLAVALGSAPRSSPGWGWPGRMTARARMPGPKATSQHAGRLVRRRRTAVARSGRRSRPARIAVPPKAIRRKPQGRQHRQGQHLHGWHRAPLLSKGSTTSGNVSSSAGYHRRRRPDIRGNAPLLVDSPVALALAAFARREASSAASTTHPVASITTSANLSASSAKTITRPSPGQTES